MSNTTKTNTTKTNTTDEISATSKMCEYCFDTLIYELIPRNSSNTLNTIPVPTLPNDLSSLPPFTSSPLFITWEKRRKDTINTNDEEELYEIRGCIGSLSPQPLYTAIREYAITSAFRDKRFNPISQEEISELRVGVSLLVKYEECNHVYDWEIGIHGIIIRFQANSITYSATFLPEVSKEQGWSKEQTIASLVRKAGYHHFLTPVFLNTIHCQRYQSSKCKLRYDEYTLCSEYYKTYITPNDYATPAPIAKKKSYCSNSSDTCTLC